MGAVAAEALPAHAIVFRSVGLGYCIVMGLSQAATVHTALAHGAARARRETRTRRAAQHAALLFAAALLGAFTLAPDRLSLLFANGDGERIAADIGVLMPLAGLAIAVLVPGNVAMGILRGRADVGRPALLTVSGYWVIGLGTMGAMAAAGALDAAGVWTALAAGSAAASLGACLYLAWRLRQPGPGRWAAPALQPA
jgi:Na+-driven multidrug efflux pump